MRISDWSSDLCSSDLSASGEPAPDLVPARFLLHGLEESDEMNDERDQRPARNRDDPPIGPADQQQREQDHHVGIAACRDPPEPAVERSEEHTSELQSLMRFSYAVFCLTTKISPNSMTRHTN